MLYLHLDVSFSSVDELARDFFLAGDIAENNALTVVISPDSLHGDRTLDIPVPVSFSEAVSEERAKEMAEVIFRDHS